MRIVESDRKIYHISQAEAKSGGRRIGKTVGGPGGSDEANAIYMLAKGPPPPELVQLKQPSYLGRLTIY
jgi:hypothetical protein